MTKEDYKKLVDAADIVCLNCTQDTLKDNSCCDRCPVRKTLDDIEVETDEEQSKEIQPMLNEEDIVLGKQYKFKTDYSEYIALDCAECIVTIIRPLEDGKEIDKIEVGPMWLAKSDNGHDMNVYLDELWEIE